MNLLVAVISVPTGSLANTLIYCGFVEGKNSTFGFLTHMRKIVKKRRKKDPAITKYGFFPLRKKFNILL